MIAFLLGVAAGLAVGAGGVLLLIAVMVQARAPR